MIVSKHFVYIHTSRSGGTFLNKLILEHVPGAQMLKYHGHLGDLPEEFSHLPVIGFVRNPWDWYVSMFYDYRRKQQYVFKIIFDGGPRGFEAIISTFLRLGDNSDQSKSLLAQLVKAAPTVIDAEAPPRLHLPGLTSEHFANYSEDQGYYSWLFRLMYESKNSHRIHIGRFENLREEALRLFEETGTPITRGITDYLKETDPMNSSPRPKDFVGGYPPELEQLVADKEKYLIDRFGYDLSEAHGYPKTGFFNELGTADVSKIVDRVKSIPESQWESENEEKPNKLNKLNDTEHVLFRFVDGYEKVYDYHDLPLWAEWKDVLLPVMEQAAQALGYDDYRFPRVMLARLPASGQIFDHSDRAASYFIHKIHVPLITNEKTMFRVGQQEQHLRVGEIVEVNNKRNHAVRNDGDQDRIHLIFECYSMEDYGKPG